MQRKRLFVMTALVVAVVAILVLHTFGVTNTGIRMEFQTISKGAWSGLTKAEYYVIQDGNEWAHVWSQHTRIMHPQDPLLEVDFSEKTIIAVFMGTRVTTGYGIEVKEIIDTGLSIVVKVEKTYPGKGCVVGDAITTPYHIVTVNKIDKYIIFDTFTRARECN